MTQHPLLTQYPHTDIPIKCHILYRRETHSVSGHLTLSCLMRLILHHDRVESYDMYTVTCQISFLMSHVQRNMIICCVYIGMFNQNGHSHYIDQDLCK